MTRPFAAAGFSAFAVLVLLCALDIGIAVPLSIGAAVISLPLFLLAIFGKRRVLSVMLAAGAVSCTLFFVTYFVRYAPALGLDGSDITVDAVITGEGELKSGKWYYPAKTLTVNGENKAVRLRLISRKMLRAEPYDRIRGDYHVYRLFAGKKTMRIDPSSHACIGAYPTDFTGEDICVFAVAKNKKPVMLRLMALQKALRNALMKTVSGEEGALARALLFGKSSEFPEKLGKTFNHVGVSHIICVSGLHLSVWALLSLRIFRRLKLNTRAASVLSALFVLLFMGLTGFSYSVTRAGIMMLIYLFAVFLMDSSDGINSLGIAACIILSADPFAASDAGFLLSFLSTLGILVVSPVCTEKINSAAEKIKPGVLRGAFCGAASIITSSAAALIFTLPVMLLYFGGVNFISFFGNLLILPVASAGMISAGVTSLISLSPALLPIACFPGLLCSVICRYIIFVSRFLSRFSFAGFYPDERFSKLFLCLAAIAAAVGFTLGIKRKKLRIITAAVLSVMFAAFVAFSHAFSASVAQLTAIDCGNAVSVMVKCGKELSLFGCGEDGFISDVNISGAADQSRAKGISFLYIPGNDDALCGNAQMLASGYDIGSVEAAPDFEKGYLFGSGCRKTVSGSLDMPEKAGTAVCIAGGKAVFAEICGARVLMIFDPGLTFDDIPEKYRLADIVVSREKLPEGYAGGGVTVLSRAADDGKSICTAGKGNIVIDIYNGGCFAHREGSFCRVQ